MLDERPAIDDLTMQQLLADFTATQDFEPLFDEIVPPGIERGKDSADQKPQYQSTLPETISPSLLSFMPATSTNASLVKSHVAPPLRTIAPTPTSSTSVAPWSSHPSQPHKRQRKKDQPGRRGNNRYGRKGTNRCAQCLKHHQKVHQSCIKLKRLVYVNSHCEPCDRCSRRGEMCGEKMSCAEYRHLCSRSDEAPQ